MCSFRQFQEFFEQSLNQIKFTINSEFQSNHVLIQCQKCCFLRQKFEYNASQEMFECFECSLFEIDGIQTSNILIESHSH